MSHILVERGWALFQWAYRTNGNIVSDFLRTSSWRTAFLIVFALWLPFSIVRTTVTDFWYGLNFNEPWTSSDYPPLCSDKTSGLLPWMASGYPAFRSPDSNIRLLHIHPSRDIWGIETTLESQSFLERPQYRTLSYTWGSTEKTKPITVNGKRMDVGENLWNALFYIRDLEKSQTVWIDAISINQGDNEEKSIQVPLMSFIYSRAQEVIVWLGDHTGPRWIEQARFSQWHGDWAISRATDEWAVTKYWLYLLTQEEYWKRCWIVQEIAMASRIRVVSGYSALPWSEFIRLMKLYKKKVPLDSASIDPVLKLDDLREAKYSDGDVYALDKLLDQFGDCFSSLKLDRIFAFVGMASDCLENCLIVDYSKSLLSIYQELLAFWNTRCLRTADEAVETTWLAGLVRSILSKKEISITKHVVPPNPGENADSFSYFLCGESRKDYCNLVPKLQSVISWIDLIKSLSLRTFSYLFQIQSATKSIWLLPSSPESSKLWAAKTPAEVEGNQILVRSSGVVAGVVCDLGPTYREFIEQPYVPRRWAAKLGNIWGLACNDTSMRSAKSINERLTMLLGSASDHRIRNFMSLNTDSPYSFYSSRLFIAFGPHREVILGLTPWETNPGDLLVQYWKTNSVVITRPQGIGQVPILVGRAGIVKDGSVMDWDTPSDRARFQPSTAWAFDHFLPIWKLTQLSFDTASYSGRNIWLDEHEWNHPKHTWTSHDFEMNEIEMFAGGNSYENQWDIEGAQRLEGRGDLDAESCLKKPCQVYSSMDRQGIAVPV
ncbi:hypothetical protein BT63DRAFT_412934 [Microthyrium microscopicum]|uniref:Heterokaryon incompatibility domain-containing protein n=1 Tax=Microthyrium microscopicum TaxID=703497 RepID=A0A6A6UH24_9PEZI|nr:hypothetical protein BT63DRAFT_412934 [Microthyrium microscopicum]